MDNKLQTLLKKIGIDSKKYNYFENGILVDGKKTKEDKCPICSRPYKEGSTVCPYCSDKKKIVYGDFKKIFKELH